MVSVKFLSITVPLRREILEGWNIDGNKIWRINFSPNLIKATIRQTKFKPNNVFYIINLISQIKFLQNVYHFNNVSLPPPWKVNFNIHYMKLKLAPFIPLNKTIRLMKWSLYLHDRCFADQKAFLLTSAEFERWRHQWTF